jgi:C4-dicarboxylate-specific signal transduction histidine kinase
MDGAWGRDNEVTRDLDGQPIRWQTDAAELERLDRLELTAVLSGGLAHDLGTPLAALHLELAALAGHLSEIAEAPGAAPPRAAAAVTRARASALAIDEVAGYMTRLVRDFIRFTRGKRPAQGVAEVRACVDTAVRLSHAVAAGRAAFALRVARGLLVRVPDRTLVRVLVNLVVNAAEAFPRADTLANQITITADRRGPHVLVEVADNARGITPEMQPHLFEPWHTTKRGDRGLGLGLAVGRSLLREAGGELELVDTGAHGTRFRCLLPSGM